MPRQTVSAQKMLPGCEVLQLHSAVLHMPIEAVAWVLPKDLKLSVGIPNPNSLRVGSPAAAASPNPPATSSASVAATCDVSVFVATDESEACPAARPQEALVNSLVAQQDTWQKTRWVSSLLS